MSATRRRLPLPFCNAARVLRGLLLFWAATTAAAAQEPAGDQAAAREPVAATVNGVEITVAEVDRFVARLASPTPAAGAARDRLRAAALDQLVDQQLVLAQLEQLGEACSPRELDLAASQFRQELHRQDQSLEDHCRSQGIPVAAFLRALRWQLSWPRYLEKMQTDERLQQYFAAHRPEFDGTRLRVAHVLLALPADPHEQAAVLARAAAIREEIVAGRLAFADAARQYSQGPSAQAGGELGWITRQGPMPDVFTRAAYGLQAGELSAPVVSRFGVHLIACREVEPGQVGWEDVRGSLRAAVAKELFGQLAARARETARIQDCGAVPRPAQSPTAPAP
jgi:parvulin-like peptidyl-prolyl isomerase